MVTDPCLIGRFVGAVIVLVGAFYDLTGSIGMLRFPNFFTRLHAATVGAIGGSVLPMLGVSIYAASEPALGEYRWFMAGASAVAAIIILIVAPAGTHALARAAYRSGSAPKEPYTYDAGREEGGGG